jgi:thioredoxin reductase (NADPH)
MDNELKQILIVGSGPAGLTAALYAARADLSPLVLEGEVSSGGDQPGGQLMLTTDVENYPGFPDGVLGPTLMGQMRAQAERFGAQLVTAKASKVELGHGGPHRVWYEEPSSGVETSVTTRALVLAMGARSLRLGVPGEREFLGHGVSTCATCDAFFFRGEHVAVIGGGDSAVEEALFITKFAESVTVVHRRDQLRASKIMQDRAFANQKIRFLWDTVVVEVLGATRVEGIRTKNVRSGEESILPVSGVFVAIGHAPNTDLVRGQVELDPDGYVLTMGKTTATSVDGVFAAGDVVDRRYRQAVTAAGAGCMAAIDAERWLEARAHEQGPAKSEAKELKSQGS